MTTAYLPFITGNFRSVLDMAYIFYFMELLNMTVLEILSCGVGMSLNIVWSECYSRYIS